MALRKHGEKMVQIPVPLELYAKISQYAAENRRNLRQQIIFDMEKMYLNVKLTQEYANKFDLHVNGAQIVGAQTMTTDDDDEELL